MKVIDLKPAPYNPRTMQEVARKGLAVSLGEFGDISGLVWNKRTGHLVAGHQRLSVLQQEHGDQLRIIKNTLITPKGEKYPIRIVDWSEDKERLANITANNPAIQGSFTEQARSILDGISETNQKHLLEPLRTAELMKQLPLGKPLQGKTDADDIPETPTKPTTKPGDLYILGNHRLICGDSTDRPTIKRLLGRGRKPELMVTDPPYGVNYDPEWRSKAGVAKKTKKMGKVANDHRADWREAWQLFPGDVAYVYHGGIHAAIVHESLEASGLKIRAQIIWAKDRLALSRGDYHWQHEPCWYATRHEAIAYAVKDGKPSRRTADRTQSTLWFINAREDGGHGHGTQKPVECMRRPMENHIASVIYEPFCGSGTTIITAEQAERRCYAAELDPKYCDVIVARWEAFTGKTAERKRG